MRLFGIEISFGPDDHTLDVLSAQYHALQTAQQERYAEDWESDDEDINIEQAKAAILSTMRERNRLRSRLESRGWKQTADGWEQVE